MADKETWKNVSAGKHFVNKYDRFGNKEQVMVGSGNTVTLTKEEREILNQESNRTASLDLFQNGILVPITLVDEDDIRLMADNPNLMSETDLKDLIKAHWKIQEAKIAAITNGATLSRLREIAIEADVTVKTLHRIEDRIAEIDPSLLSGINEVEVVGRVISTVGPDSMGGSPTTAPMTFKRKRS